VLNWRLPCQLQRLFKLKLLNHVGAFVEYRSALGLTTIPKTSGNFDPVLKIVQVRTAIAAVTLQVFGVGNIIGCPLIIPEIATSSKTGDRWTARWIVNSHIDLATWKEVNYK